jgi:hypothetical protein
MAVVSILPGAERLRQCFTLGHKFAESRADHGLENFRRSL